MEELITNLTRGNVTEVKVVLASIVTALACYQVALMAVGYGKVRLRFLAADPASRAHRAIGDGIVVITVMVATMCISYFELEDDATAHVIAAISLLVPARPEDRGHSLDSRPESTAPGDRAGRLGPVRGHLRHIGGRLPGDPMNEERRSHGRQMLGSLLVALTIVAVVIVAVTARLGPTSVAEEEAQTERLEQRLELREERLERRQEALEEATERR
jgi:Family of unknown function (DUF6529)